MLHTPSDAFRSHYQALIASGAIEADPAQAEVANAFADLDRRLAGYKPARKQGLFGRLFADKEEPPRGLYVHGEVGRGKTMLMDLFFQHSPVAYKRRAHFHEFMADVHERIYNYRQSIARGEVADHDVIALTAASIFDEAWLLCFDEFHVTDIADAMILGRLFQKLFDLGTVVVATSNVAPEDLYKGGLNRALFLPFIAQIEADRWRALSAARYRDQGSHPACALLGAWGGTVPVCRAVRTAARGLRLSPPRARLPHHPGRPDSGHGLWRAQRRQALHHPDRHAL